MIRGSWLVVRKRGCCIKPKTLMQHPLFKKRMKLNLCIYEPRATNHEPLTTISQNNGPSRRRCCFPGGL